jgi:hypothetical protein
MADRPLRPSGTFHCQLPDSSVAITKFRDCPGLFTFNVTYLQAFDRPATDRLQILDAGQYRHVSVMDAEIGKLLGGWRKRVERK